MTAPEPIFRDPPSTPRARGVSKWHRTVQSLKARPAEWALIATRPSDQSARNMASNIRRGFGVWAPIGAYEATARGCGVYARFIGGQP